MRCHQTPKANLEDILDTLPISAICSDTETGKVTHVNPSFCEHFGFVFDDMTTMEEWFGQVLIEPYEFFQRVKPWMSQHTGTRSSATLDTTLLCKHRRQKRVSIRFTLLGDTKIWYLRDTTDHWVVEERLKVRGVMLEMVAKSSALSDILNVIVLQIQKESPQTVCSVLLFDKSEDRLRLGAAPDLPDFYNQAIDGVKIGMNVGSCGTSAYLNERVVVDDIAAHPYWQDYKALAAQAGLAACWSDPIRSSKGELLGTFAIYKMQPARPTEGDFELIQFASNLASIAIEHFRTQEALEHMAYSDHLTGLANRGAFFNKCDIILKDALDKKTPMSVIMMDIDNFKRINDQHGHEIGDLVLQSLAKACLAVLRRKDLMARIGGEEFAILLPETDKEEALIIAERVRVAIEKDTVVDRHHQLIPFTASLGVTCRSSGGCLTDKLLSRADKALYQAKADGKNQVASLDPS
ncbi:diguanylate cyclase [Marinomonas algarum]|uniref:diguanylate cyclase n=1 Tax=Marinomonas algarum TaxID=2883105 RepID=A0A9X1IN69_9GAMM|nr:diguanylate cyclase [Marinomonas algarum]MCB5162333.1 diguanylate cyclase [Marinomonas algarum]